MKINIANFDDGLNQLDISEPSRELTLLDHGHLKGDIQVKLVIDKRLDDLNLKAKVVSSAELVCDRCLRKFEKELESHFEVYYSSKYADSEKENTRHLNLSNPIINLLNDVRSSLVLSLPIKLLCEEDCKGLCPSCGVNWNQHECDCHPEQIDSIWEPLKNLQVTES